MAFVVLECGVAHSVVDTTQLRLSSAVRVSLDGTANVGVGGWGPLGGLAISPDGEHVAYIGDDDGGDVVPGRGAHTIWIKPLAGGAARRVAIADRPLGISDLVFSPDGRSLVFWSPGGLRRVSIDGGPTTLICPTEETRGLSWGADGQIVFGSRARIMRVAASGGTPDTLVTISNALVAANPEILPGSGAVLFTQYPIGFAARPQIIVQQPRAGARVVVAREGYDARYVPASGEIIYELLGKLFAVPFDAGELRITGPATVVIDDVTETRYAQRGRFDVSANGTLLYATGRHGWREGALVARDGTRKTVARFTGTTASVRVSPEGARVAFDGDGHVWLARLGDPMSLRPLTTGEWDHGPVWSPDGRRLVFGRFNHDDRTESIDELDADGSRQARQVILRASQPDSWSRSGQLSFFRRIGDSYSLWTYDVETRRSQLVRYLAHYGAASAFSPNGKWLAYEDSASRTPVEAAPGRIYVESMAKPGKRIEATRGGGARPAWSPDGRELFFCENGRLFVVNVRDTGELPAFDDPKPLPIAGFLQRGGDVGFDTAERGYDPTPDGQSFIMMFPAPVEVAAVPGWSASRRQMR